MSMKVAFLGIGGMFIGIVMSVMAMTNMIPPMIYIYIMIGISFFMGMSILMVSILLNGVMGPFLDAKFSGRNLIAVLTASKRIKLMSGREKSGMTKTEMGLYITPPDTVYSWPNGAKGGIGYFKYGTTLTPKFIKGMSKLRESGISNFGEMEKLNEEAMKDGKEFNIRLD